MSVMLRWQEAAIFAIAALITGAAYFACWLRSSRTSAEADAAYGAATRGFVAPTQSLELELPA
jgi:hypothetical protein